MMLYLKSGVEIPVYRLRNIYLDSLSESITTISTPARELLSKIEEYGDEYDIFESVSFNETYMDAMTTLNDIHKQKEEELSELVKEVEPLERILERAETSSDERKTCEAKKEAIMAKIKPIQIELNEIERVHDRAVPYSIPTTQFSKQQLRVSWAELIDPDVRASIIANLDAVCKKYDIPIPQEDVMVESRSETREGLAQTQDLRVTSQLR